MKQEQSQTSGGDLNLWDHEEFSGSFVVISGEDIRHLAFSFAKTNQ